MKIAFNRRQRDGATLGPYIFLERLVKYLRKQKGVEIVRNPGRFHNLHFINISSSGRLAARWKAKSILRIDGIYHDLSRDSYKLNEGIKDTYHNVDGVIFQCDFSKQMMYKYLGRPLRARHETIIYNGATLPEGNLPANEYYDYGRKYGIVVSGNWSSPSKRIYDMITCFTRLYRNDVRLVVLGAVKEEIKHPLIEYKGTLPADQLYPYYASADLMLHLAYTDWCPNSAVEAMSCGTPVITTHNGGVPEIVKDHGIVIESDPDYNGVCGL